MTKVSIMVIDDEVGIAKYCERVLTTHGHEVRSFNDAGKGLEILKNEVFELLLVDIRMPGLNGFKVIEKARTMHPEIAVVIMTGFGTMETALEAFRQGADSMILKPFENKQELIRCIEEALTLRENRLEHARLKAIKPLLNFSEKFMAVIPVPELVTRILEDILEYMHADYAAIYSQDKSNKSPILFGEKYELNRSFVALDEETLSQLFAQDRPQFISIDSKNAGSFLADPDATAGNKHPTILAAPISRPNTVWFMLAGRDRKSKTFNQADLDFFNLLSRQAAIALENSSLYAELNDYILQLEASQKSLVQSEKLAALGKLSASIAHEINNPLQSVRNCIHLVENDQLSMEEKTEYLEIAKREIDRLRQTVQRMLEFNHSELQEKKAVNLTQLIGNVLALLENQLRDRSIEIHTSYDSSLRSVNLIENQMQQVIINLILNAMEAIGENGEITISTELKTDKALIFIQDSGCGIETANRSKIFEPFFSSKAEGTGLGLSISYEIIKNHGGELNLLESIEPGACFCIQLPVVR